VDGSELGCGSGNFRLVGGLFRVCRKLCGRGSRVVFEAMDGWKEVFVVWVMGLWREERKGKGGSIICELGFVVMIK